MNDLGDFSDLTDSAFEQERKKALAATAPLAVSVASTKSPDAAAKAQALARRYNLPPLVVDHFAEDYAARAKQEDAEALMRTAPKLGSWIAEKPERADIVHDDLEGLAGIEQTIGKIASYVVGARPDGGLPTMIAKAARSVVAGAGPQLGAGAYGAAAYPAEALGMDGVGARLRELQRSSMAVADQVAGTDKNAGMIERGIMSGMRSAGQTMATLPLGFARTAVATGEQLMLGAMGALTFGQTYGKARDEGLSVGKAGLYGMQDATAEVVTEKFLGAAKLIGDAKAGMSAAKMFMRDIAREIPGEMGATLWQNFNEWANVNPDKSLNEWLSEQPEALAETVIATIVGGGAQVGAIRGIQKITGDAARRQALADAAEDHASNVEKLAALLAASKTASRDATTMREYLAQVADDEGEEPTQLLVDGDKLLNVLNQSGMSRDEFAALAPTVAAQLDEALTGAAVRVPVVEFMAAGDKITAPLIDHLRKDDDSPTRAEAREYMAGEGKALQDEVERELSKRSDATAFREGIASIESRIKAELQAAGRTSDVARAEANLVANYFGATAARLGKTPDELVQQYELRVQAKREAEQGRNVLAESSVFEQGRAAVGLKEGEAFDEAKARPEVSAWAKERFGDKQAPDGSLAWQNFVQWFSDSKAVDAQGRPLVVYRGEQSGSTHTVFDARNTRESGFFFTPEQDVAAGYARGGKPRAFYIRAQRVLDLTQDNKASRAWVRKWSKNFDEWIDRYSGEEVDAFDYVQSGQLFDYEGDWSAERWRDLQSSAADEFDLLIAPDTGEGRVFPSYIVFDSRNIKSATDNNGRFDPADPSILNQDAKAAEERKAKIIELRKRESVLKSLQECLGG